MKKLLLALALLLVPAAAAAQCTGVFTNNTVCGNATGSNNTPRATPSTSFPSTTSFANPTASVGATAVNGSASTAMRSDAAPPLASGAAAANVGTLGGDLSGTLPNPTVAKVNGVTFPASPSANTVPIADGAGNVAYTTVPNAALANSATTVNGATCTLGASCSITSGAPGLVLVSNPAGTWQAQQPDGTAITCSGATDCLQKGIAYATTNRKNFQAVCPDADFISVTGPLEFGPGTSIHYNMNGCSIAFSGFSSEPITVDTLDQGSYLQWTSGYITSTATSTSLVYIHPHTAAPDGGVAFQTSQVDLPYMLAGATLTQGIIRFDASATGFSIANGNKFNFQTEDGNAGGFFADSCIKVDLPAVAFVQNEINFGSCHNFVTYGISIGNGAPSFPLATNIWRGGIYVGTTSSIAFDTYGQLDQIYLASVSVNAGSLSTGITFHTGANNNYIIAPQMAGTTAVSDSGTGNCGVINDKQKACPGGSW